MYATQDTIDIHSQLASILVPLCCDHSLGWFFAAAPCSRGPVRFYIKRKEMLRRGLLSVKTGSLKCKQTATTPPTLGHRDLSAPSID